MSKIDLNNISHSYNPNDPNPVYALNPFSMTWENGKRYAILGPSGCGKTTMLNIVSGLVRPSAGNILFDDKDVTDLKTESRNIAQVFQFPVIYNTGGRRGAGARPFRGTTDCLGQSQDDTRHRRDGQD